MNRRLIARNPLLAIEAPTFRWVDQALAATRELMEQDLDPGLPILLLQGENDRVVGGEEQRQFCRRLDDCRPGRPAGGEARTIDGKGCDP